MSVCDHFVIFVKHFGVSTYVEIFNVEVEKSNEISS